MTILHRETKRIKLNRTVVISNELSNRNEVLNNVGSNKNIIKMKGSWKDSITRSCHRKSGTISNNNG